MGRTSKKGKLGFSGGVVAWRESLGMTQRQFADALGIDRHTINNWKQRTTTPSSAAWYGIRQAIKDGVIPVPNVAKDILLKEQHERTDQE